MLVLGGFAVQLVPAPYGAGGARDMFLNRDPLGCQLVPATPMEMAAVERVSISGKKGAPGTGGAKKHMCGKLSGVLGMSYCWECPECREGLELLPRSLAQAG